MKWVLEWNNGVRKDLKPEREEYDTWRELKERLAELRFMYKGVPFTHREIEVK